MMSYYSRNSEDILYEGFFEISKAFKILSIKKSILVNLSE